MKIDSNTPIYNGYSLRQLISRLNANIPKLTKKWYLQNCIEVYKNECAGINKGYNECLRNTNFNIVKLFLNS